MERVISAGITLCCALMLCACSSGDSGLHLGPLPAIDDQGHFVVPADIADVYAVLETGADPETSGSFSNSQILRGKLYHDANTESLSESYADFEVFLRIGPYGEFDQRIASLAAELGATVSDYSWSEYGTSVTFSLPLGINPQHAMQIYEFLISEIGEDAQSVDGLVADLNLPV